LVGIRLFAVRCLPRLERSLCRSLPAALPSCAGQQRRIISNFRNQNQKEKTTPHVCNHKAIPNRFCGEINKAVSEKFVPRIKQLPGFVAYYGIDSGDSDWSSVSVFDSKANAEASIQLARDFVTENDLTLSSPQITSGEVVAN
jgi:hypothetical protein